MLKELENTERPNFPDTWRGAGCCVRVILVIKREWEASVGELDHRNTQRPHVRFDRILGTLDSLRL